MNAAPTTATAAIADGKGGFSIDEVEIDAPAAGEVQVAIRASGLCHTDVNMLADEGPLIMGHEGAGVVTAVGAGVTSTRPGDRVMLNWARSCGDCRACRAGLTNRCEAQVPVHDGGCRYRGVSIDASFGLGTMSTVALVHERAVTPITVDMPWTSACLFGCCVMTGFGSATTVAGVEPDSSVVVIGAGAVGLCAIQGARIAGARLILAVDLNPAKLEASKAFGATHTLLVDAADRGLGRAAERAAALTDGGADVALEATSVPELCTAPLLFVRDGGTAVQLSGVEQEVTIDASAFLWDKTYITSLYGRCDPRRDFARLQRLYADGSLDVDGLVSAIYPLEDLDRAIGDLMSGQNIKSVLLPA
jgi:S-(hydroxymethyl)glutathione dehydrogenase/alcohol dehydrogenase